MQSKGKSAPRLSDVARLADVSPGLVSRILNDDPSLKTRPETRARVLAAVEMLQYTPNPSARALRSAQTGLLGFALHSVHDPIYVRMVGTAQKTAAEHNYSIVLLNADEIVGRPETFRELIRGHLVDGLVIQSGFSEDSRILQELAKSVPSLVFNASENPSIRTVRLDDITAAMIATRHLIDLGHTNIAFVGAVGGSSVRRYQGYLAALAEKGLVPTPMIAGGWDVDEAREATSQYFANGGKATGLVVVTTTSALGVHAGILSAGLSIPHDVSIVSIHDSWFAPHLNPALTVVAMPLAEVGGLMVEILLEQIRSPHVGETILDDPRPQLIERGSAGPAP